MTRIILFLLKCVLGLFATVGFLLIAAIVVAAVLLPRYGEDMPQEAVLLLDLSDGLIERRPANPLARASLGGALVLREAVDALHAAGRDERVKALVIRAGWGSPGLAQMQELRDAVADFRAQGKPVVAFAETFGEAGNGTLQYFLASAAGEVWLQPSGDVGITGFILQQPFLKSLLEEIGVRSQIAQREEYKGAMSFLTDENMPAPVRENLQRYLDSALSQVVTAVAEARNLEAGRLRALIDRAPYRGAEAQRLGLVDRLGYWDEVEAAVEDSAGPEAEWLTLRAYRRATWEEETEAPVVALVHGEGPIVLGGGENDPVFGRVSLGAIDIAEAISEAVDDPEVEAILFRVDSPGGSYVGSDTIWREVQRARDAGKPVVVSMGNVAASGGYFVSTPADAIVAQPGTLTGSIGVVAGKVSLRDLWADLGVNWDGVQAGDRAALFSPNAPFSRSEWDWLQRTLDTTYADFTGKVAAGRGLSQEYVLTVAKGQIWSGADAKEAGLVDALGGYRTALDLAKAAAELPEDAAVRLRPFPEARDPFEILDEIEQKLALDTAPVTWSIGRGKSFVGTYNLANNTMRRSDADVEPLPVNGPESDAVAGLLPENERDMLVEEMLLGKEACRPFDMQAFREGHLTPVYFGSALRNFGVRDLIEALGAFGPAPRAQDADARKVEATEDKMTSFVFKIQANMDPNHRDRIAFVRVCSGKLQRGMKAKLVRTGKPISLSAPQFFFAKSRITADEAYAGDVVGIPNHGTLRIGDTLTEGEELLFRGVPNFAPEILRRVRLGDAMKAKKLKEALQQMAEEGVVQLFTPEDGSPAIVGVVGALQLDVLKERLKIEYSLPVDFEMARFSVCRWISSDEAGEVDRFIAAHRGDIARDLDEDPVFLAQHEFGLNYEADRWKAVRFSTVKDYQTRKAA